MENVEEECRVAMLHGTFQAYGPCPISGGKQEKDNQGREQVKAS